MPSISINTSSGGIVMKNSNMDVDFTKIQKESSFDCNTFSGTLDKKYCGEDKKVIDEALVLWDEWKCEELSNIPRKESCKEQIITRKAAKSWKNSDCDSLSYTWARESCRANMSHWTIINESIFK